MDEQFKPAGKSLVTIVPRNNNVLVKMEFEVSVVALTSGKKDSLDDDDVIFTIAGIGPMVNDLALGEKIILQIQQNYEVVEVPGNERSIRKLEDFYRKLKPAELTTAIKDTPKVTVIQYGMFPEFQIKAHSL